jgi:hypothetical protein
MNGYEINNYLVAAFTIPVGVLSGYIFNWLYMSTFDKHDDSDWWLVKQYNKWLKYTRFIPFLLCIIIMLLLIIPGIIIVFKKIIKGGEIK